MNKVQRRAMHGQRPNYIGSGPLITLTLITTSSIQLLILSTFRYFILFHIGVCVGCARGQQAQAASSRAVTKWAAGRDVNLAPQNAEPKSF